MRTERPSRPHAVFTIVAVAAVAVVAAAAMLGHSVQGAHAAIEPLHGMPASPSIAFPVSVPVGETGLITVNYTAAPALPLPDAGGADGPGVVILRYPAGIEVVSPGFEVYQGPVGLGGSAHEFAVFYARKALPPAASGASLSEEITIRIVDPPAPSRNFVDVHVAGFGGSAPMGYSADLEARGGVVYFAAAPAGGGDGPATPPTEISGALRLTATPPDALPSSDRMAAHLASALSPGTDVAAWLAEHAVHMPVAYREEVAAAYRALLASGSSGPRGAAGADGASGLPQPAFPFPSISSYVYGTLTARGGDGVMRGQAGVTTCMYDVGDDNRTLTLLDNLADPSDPRGACTTTSSTGFFGMSVLTLDPTDPGSPVDLRIVFRADAPHSRIADARNGTYELHAATVGDLSDPIVGLNVTVPDGHEFRRALWVLGTIGAAHARIAAEFGHDTPAADVRWDPASPAASSYNRTSGTVTVSSVHGWVAHHGAEASPASIAHAYAQHVLAGLSVGNASDVGVECQPYLRIDLPASPDGCAWRSGWAHFAAAVVQESPSLRYHHLPVAVDLEAPGYDVGGRHVYGFARGSDVPGNVAGTLWDLYDAPGELGDSVSGAGAAVWNATAGMRYKGDLSILDFWHSWAGIKSNPPMRSVLALNGIDVPPDAPPALSAASATLAVPYGGTAQVEANATAAGPVAFELVTTVANGTGRIVPPPAFANLTYQYEGAGLTTALIELAPNASDVGLHLLNVTARTQGGLSNHTVITVNVTDSTPPYFASVPWDVYVEAAGSLTAVNATELGVRALDEADPLPSLSHSPAGPLPLGGHYVRWTATDASNNTAAATMHLTIGDSAPPVFEGVDNLTLALAPGDSPVASYAVPNATDLVDGAVTVSCWPRQESPIPWGATTVTCDAHDRSANSARASFWINATRDDSLGGPAVSESNSTVALGYNRTARVEVNATGEGPSTMSLAAVDRGLGTGAMLPPAFANLTYRYEGAGLTTALIELAPNASDVGLHLLNVTARTQGGLSNHTVITVNVTDSTPPYFASVPWDVYVEAAGSLTAVNATELGVRVLDEADPLPSLSHSPAGPLPLGGHYVRWTATDASNNTAAATMHLTIGDSAPPVFEGVDNLTLALAPGDSPVASYAVPNATDLVDGAVTVSCWPRQESPIPWGATTVTCDAGDRSGNYAWARFSINATRDDSLGGPAVSESNSTVALGYNRTARVEVNATGEGPSAMSLAAVDRGLGTGAMLPPAFANLTYRYEGAGLTTALIELAPNASDVGLHLLNVTARTQGGLSNHTVITVNVTDSTPPYFASVPWDVYVEAAGSLTAVNATELGVRALDEADPRPGLLRSPDGPLPLGDHRIRWTATDASNNTAVAIMRLFIVDTTPPSFSGTPADASVEFAPGVEPRASYVPPNATDIVDGNVAVICSPPPGSPVQPGPTLVACDASDLSGNSARASFWFNATLSGDAVAPLPLILSNGIVVVPYNSNGSVLANAAGTGVPTTLEMSSLDARGRAAPAPAFVGIEYLRSGGNATEALIVLSPNATDVGVHRINVTAVSRGAPTAHAVLTVNVTDGTPPFLLAPAEAVLEAAGNLTRISASDLGVSAVDAVDPSPSLLGSPPGPLPLGVHSVRWTATDASGNEDSALMRLTIRDTTPPAFGATPNATLAFPGGAQPVADYEVPPALDLVDGGYVRVQCLPPPGSFVSWGLTQVVCVALDASNNAAWARFWINATGGG